MRKKKLAIPKCVNLCDCLPPLSILFSLSLFLSPSVSRLLYYGAERREEDRVGQRSWKETMTLKS